MFSKKATEIDEIFTVDLTLCSKCQIDGEYFVNFCGLLRKHQLYKSSNGILFKHCEMWASDAIIRISYRIWPSLKSILNVLTVHSLTLIFVVICVLWQAVFSRKKYRFEIAHKTCSHWLMTLKTLDGFCHAIKHFFNENCKKGKFPYRLFCCKIMTKTTVQSLLPDSTFEFKFSWSKAVSYWMSSLSKWKSKF